MFGDSKAFTGFSVNDIEAAKEFYAGALGLEVVEEAAGLGLKLATGGAVFVYPKDDHEPASFTVLNFPVDDIEAAVAGLAERGIDLERIEGFEHDELGIAAPEMGPRIGWFRDPAGNTLSVIQA